MIVIGIIQSPAMSLIVYEIMQVLARHEAENCPECAEIFNSSGMLPVHCPSCDKRRELRWAFMLQQKAKTISMQSIDADELNRELSQ
ncbi:hypothetical protein LCGC14_0761770 [marine sediment metagenome]|uniref:Uncharacterized protein n=1 Tax=marine sediment metagenome TaxID=412755 RepID=A0A0F9QKT6_9ZZZZ